MVESKKPSKGLGFGVASHTRKIDMMGLISLIRSLMSTSNHAACSISNPSCSRMSAA